MRTTLEITNFRIGWILPLLLIVAPLQRNEYVRHLFCLLSIICGNFAPIESFLVAKISIGECRSCVDIDPSRLLT